MSDKTSLGDRMKRYEKTAERYLVKKMPVIIRFDGKAFHTFTKGLPSEFDDYTFRQVMENTMIDLCNGIQGAAFAYTQSDEISILLKDWQDIKTEAWFDYRQNKMESVGAAMATAFFAKHMKDLLPQHEKIGLFDARAFNLPKEEVTNYFIWRQKDMTRNSIQSLGRKYFSHKQLHKKKGNDIQEMLFKEHGINWDKISVPLKRGVCYLRPYDSAESFYLHEDRYLDRDIPIFTSKRDYIERFLD